jgi:hypothetical protein
VTVPGEASGQQASRSNWSSESSLIGGLSGSFADISSLN